MMKTLICTSLLILFSSPLLACPDEHEGMVENIERAEANLNRGIKLFNSASYSKAVTYFQRVQDAHEQHGHFECFSWRPAEGEQEYEARLEGIFAEIALDGLCLKEIAQAKVLTEKPASVMMIRQELFDGKSLDQMPEYRGLQQSYGRIRELVSRAECDDLRDYEIRLRNQQSNIRFLLERYQNAKMVHDSLSPRS